MKKVLFVCAYNTCRSPMAEQIGNKIASERGLEKEIRFYSAGLCGPVGKPVNAFAIETLRTYEIKGVKRVSKIVSVSDERNFDLVVTMENRLKDKVGFKNCVSTLDLCGFEIADPFGLGMEAYKTTAKMLEEVVVKILKGMKK